MFVSFLYMSSQLWVDHESVEICRKEQIEPVDLNHCLRAFTSEEKLEEWYHCSHCKGKKPATKKLQIWKLPPILVSKSVGVYSKMIIPQTDSMGLKGLISSNHQS